jgi:hypothetical protein
MNPDLLPFSPDSLERLGCCDIPDSEADILLAQVLQCSALGQDVVPQVQKRLDKPQERVVGEWVVSRRRVVVCRRAPATVGVADDDDCGSDLRAVWVATHRGQHGCGAQQTRGQRWRTGR